MYKILKLLLVATGIYFCVYLFNNFYFSEKKTLENNIILNDLKNKIAAKKHIKYLKKNINNFDSITKDEIEDFVRIDFEKGDFLFAHKVENKNSQSRLKKFLKFLNANVSKNIKSDYPFCFFIKLGDDCSISVRIKKDVDLSLVPLLMVDVSKKEYPHVHEKIFLVPDYYLIKPNYSNVIKRIRNNLKKYPFSSRKDVAVWRGSQTGGSYDVTTKDSIPRFKLAAFSLENPDYADARFINHTAQVPTSESGKNYIDFMNKTFGSSPEKFFMRFEDQVAYKYIVSLDGNASAWERIVFALNTESVLLYNTNYVQFFTPYLKENVHYVSIKSDISDLQEKIDFLRKHPKEAMQISENAKDFAVRYLSRKVFIRYYTDVLQSISDRFEH